MWYTGNMIRDLDQKPAASVLLAAINIIWFLIVELFFGSTEQNDVLLRAGAASVALVEEGNYVRLLTSMFVHAGIRHLLNNMLLLCVLGERLERLMGHIRFAILYLGGGLAAGLAQVWYEKRTHDPAIFMGASGAVFAEMGALLWIVVREGGRVRDMTLRQMLVMLALSLYFGFTSANVANAAHVCGLISGFLAGIVLYRASPEESSLQRGEKDG